MKKYFNLLVLAVVLCLAVPVLAFADSAYERIYTVASNGSQAQKTEFNLGQKPWLFLELPDGLEYDLIRTVVVWGEDGSAYTARPNTDPFFGPTDRKIWTTINDTTWASIQAGGSWSASPITILVKDCDLNLVTGSTNFTVNSTVVPEPISTSLFLLGAGVIGLRRRRKTSK
ncbi:MAG: PEP-CTERM sorting domain-containing protein [Candidatus Omnitrophota bacterium]